MLYSKFLIVNRCNNFQFLKRLTLLLFLFCFNGGCAFSSYRTAGTITILSNPSAADVYINGVYYGKTPLIVALSKRRNYTIEIKKEGFKSRFFKIYSLLATPVYIIGIIDGAAYEFSETRIDANLEPLVSSKINN